jgi:3-phenylpropionate/trans-cinnamate dioxygenase ferredoxin reductase component
MSAGLVIVGASYAGIQIAAAARDLGYAERIVMLGDEPHAPYQRPPLSKGYLAGKVEEAALVLRGEAFFKDSAIEFLPGRRATALDLTGRRVLMADGRHHEFAKLALACGSRARRLAVSGADLAGVHVLRSLDDARVLGEAMRTARRAVVIGGGYVGLEIAASLIGAGLSVTLLEAAGQLLARVATRPLADYVAGKHAAKGVVLRFGSTAQRILGAAGRVTAVECRDGTQVPADLVIVGIGAIPNGELAAEAGLDCRGGAILVDEQARTSVPDIVAAGDCACVERDGRLIRLESVQNANDQARAAATALVGQPAPPPAVPWFWSDQYDLKLQSAGLADGHDQVVERGSFGSDRFGLFYFRAQKLIAVDTVNRPGDHLLSRRILAQAPSLTPAQAADESFDLRAALKPAT